MSDTLDLLIIGAGPAGLAAAAEAVRGGLERVLVLEKGSSPCQMIRTFYKEGKRVDARYFGLDPICTGRLCLRDGTRESFLSFMDHVIESYEIPVRYDTEVFSVKPSSESRSPVPPYEVHASGDRTYLARCVIVAIGKMGKPRKPDYFKRIPPKIRTNKSIVFDVNSRPADGLKVLVVGGGDSAAEYSHLLSSGNDVTISYRGREFRRPNVVNRRILGEQIERKKVRALTASNIRHIEDDGGRPRVHFEEERLPPETFDLVVYGLGGMTPVDFLRAAQLEVSPQGEPLVDSASHETSRSGVFVAGDLLGRGNGGGSIISAFNSAANSTRTILSKYLKKELAPMSVTLEHLAF